MKKKPFLIAVIVTAALLLAVPAIFAAAENVPAAVSRSFPAAAVRTVGDTDVLIEVLHARVCRDTRRHGADCCIQEISGRVVSAGKSVGTLRPGDCVGFRGELSPCGSCTACRAGRGGDCPASGRVCTPSCRLHNGNCRTRLVTQEGNLIRFSDNETAAVQLSRLCASEAPCPRLRCHDSAVTDSAATDGRGCHGRGHGHSRRCR